MSSKDKVPYGSKVRGWEGLYVTPSGAYNFSTLDKKDDCQVLDFEKILEEKVDILEEPESLISSIEAPFNNHLHDY